MQTGKIILSAAALVVTAASSLAFRAVNKFSSGHQLFVQVTDGFGANVACVTCRSVRTKAAVGTVASCVTKGANHVTVRARNGRTYFTSFTATHKVNCVNAFSKSTLSQ